MTSEEEEEEAAVMTITRTVLTAEGKKSRDETDKRESHLRQIANDLYTAFANDLAALHKARPDTSEDEDVTYVRGLIEGMGLEILDLRQKYLRKSKRLNRILRKIETDY